MSSSAMQRENGTGSDVLRFMSQRNGTFAAARPGEAPEVPTPDLFPITLYYRPTTERAKRFASLARYASMSFM